MELNENESDKSVEGQSEGGSDEIQNEEEEEEEDEDSEELRRVVFISFFLDQLSTVINFF